MKTPAKYEFAVQMTCQSCVHAIQKALEGVEGVKTCDINLAQERVVVESTFPASHILKLIEETGRRAVVVGQGSATSGKHLGAAVSIFDAPGNVKGVIRLSQVTNDTCIIEGTVDGLRPGLHGLNIHEFGDLSNGCESCGGIYNPDGTRQGGPEDQERHVGDLGNISASENGRATFRIEDSRVKVWDVIGRSMVVHSRAEDLGKKEDVKSKADGNSGNGLACSIIARASGLFQNPKRFCACDGVPIWEERNVPLAGPGRREFMESQGGSNL